MMFSAKLNADAFMLNFYSSETALVLVFDTSFFYSFRGILWYCVLRGGSTLLMAFYGFTRKVLILTGHSLDRLYLA